MENKNVQLEIKPTNFYFCKFQKWLITESEIKFK